MATQTTALAQANQETFWLPRWLKSILFLAIVLTIAGIYSFFHTPIAVFPETNFPRIVIGVDNGVMPVEQMQVTITKPIEDAVNWVPGLQTVRSTTSRGSAEVSLFFSWSVDMFRTLEYVNSAISRVQQDLPTTAKITVNRLTFATFPILGYSLTTNNPLVSQSDLWELATYTLKPPLNRVDGVATVTVQGGQVPEYHVIPNFARMQASGITVLDLANSISAANMIDSPGLYAEGHQLVLALVGSQAHTLEALKQLTVKSTVTGAPVRVADLAEVVRASQPVYTYVSANGKSAVLLNIARQPASNTVAVADGVAAEVARLQKGLPQGVTIEPFYDQSQIVRESIASVRDAILIGLVLSCVILYLFLHDWRSSVIAGLVIPVTVAITVLALWLLGQSFNLMTLGGLAAAIGLVIDDAIVVVENIVLHRDAGETRVQAVRKALHEISRPLIGSTVTPVVVFLPLIAVTGVTGSFFRALAITMAVSLLTSLALAVTWTPGLAMLILKSRERSTDEQMPLEHTEHPQGRFMQRVSGWHHAVLQWSLREPLWLGVGCLALVVLTIFAYKGLGSDLLPEMDEGGFILDYVMPAGSSLADTGGYWTTSKRLCAQCRRWKAPAAAPDCRWVSPPLRKQILVTSA
jgi:multidrug efflux pump subunit AcrB